MALVERDPLGAARGASKGSARIYVPAAYPDEEYLEMGVRAVESWREIEARTGEQLLFPTGVLSAGRFAERQLSVLGAAGVEAELLEPAEAERRFGVGPARADRSLHQPDAGVIRADRALATLLRLAREARAELYGEQAVDLVEAAGDEVVVRAGPVAWRAQAAIVAAGPWSGPLLARVGIEVAACGEQPDSGVLRARLARPRRPRRSSTTTATSPLRCGIGGRAEGGAPRARPAH